MDIFTHPLKTNKKQKYLIFDTETEHLNLVTSRPWEVAWGEFSLEKDFIKGDSKYIWWEDLNISKGAAVVTRFNYEHYKKNAEDRHKILEDFEKKLYDPSYLLITHNGVGFDIYQHNNWRRGCGKKPDFSYLSRLIDTNCLAKSIKLGIALSKNIRQNFSADMLRLSGVFKKGVKTSIEALCKEYNIERDETQAHGAFYDLGLNWAVYKALINQVNI